MPIERITTDSSKMKKVIDFVKKMTKSMTFDENMESQNWVKARKRNNFFYSLMPKQKGVKFENLKWGNKGILKATTSDSKEDKIIIYLHGGGFVTGSAFVSKSYCSMLAKYMGHPVFSVEYALAPENKYPSGFEDCIAAYDKIVDEYPNSKIVLIGESAGGNYSLALAHKYKDTGKIACVIVNSPTTDFSGEINHCLNENKDFIVKLGCFEPLKRMYLGNNDAKNPYASPILGDFTGFPPTFITCDINETLYADSVELYKKCERVGVNVRMIEAEGAYHAYAVSGTNTPETEKILMEQVEFVNLIH